MKASRKGKARKQRAMRSAAQAKHGLPRIPRNTQGSAERVVEFQWTIAAYNPDLPAILSTPAMIGLMEIAAAKAIEPYLEPGTISVGTYIEVYHLKGAPQGATVRANARFIGAEGRFLIFEVQAFAGELLIGRGQVRRATVAYPTPKPSAKP